MDNLKEESCAMFGRLTKSTYLAAMFILLWCSAGCSPKAGKNPGSPASSENPIENSDPNNDGTSSSGESPGTGEDVSDFQAGQDPAMVTGINLVDIDNGRVRCDYAEKSSTDYELHCALVVLQPSGSETKALGFKNGVSPIWRDPTVKSGNVTANTCSVSTDKLTEICQISTADGFAKLQQDVDLRDQTQNRLKTASTEVLLPYSVGVAAGFVPRIPFAYQQQSQASLALVDPSSSEKLGFQRYWFPSNRLATETQWGMCHWKGSTYVADNYQVFEFAGDKMSLYAGSSDLAMDFHGVHDRYQVPLRLGITYVACGPDGVYFLSTDSSFGVLNYDGSVRLVAAHVTQGSPIGNQEMLTTLANANGISLDSAGNVFAITSDHTVYKVDSKTGAFGLIAGKDKIAGFSGDGGPASAALLNGPLSIAISPDDEIVIADSDNGRVRRIAKNGTISTIMGPDVAVAPSEAISFRPGALAFAPNGDLYVYDKDYACLYKLDKQNNVTRIAGAGAPFDESVTLTKALISPLPDIDALAIDDVGNILLMRPVDGLMKIDTAGDLRPISKAYAQVAPSDGPALETMLSDVEAVTIGDDGYTYIIDGATYSYATSGPNPYILERGVASVHQISQDGKIKRMAPASIGSQLQPAAGQTVVKKAVGIAVDSGSNMYLIENAPSSRVTRVTPSGVVSVLADLNSGLGMQNLSDIAYGTLTFGNKTGAFVADSVGKRLWFFDAQNNFAPQLLAGAALSPWVPLIDGVTIQPQSLYFSQGQLFISDADSFDIVKINSLGSLTTISVGGASLDKFTVSNSGTTYGIYNQSALVALPPGFEVNWNNAEPLPAPFFGNFDDSLIALGQCGTGRIDNKAAARNVNTALNASLAVICRARITDIYLKDTCSMAGGSITIVFSQVFGYDMNSNVVQVVKPCVE